LGTENKPELSVISEPTDKENQMNQTNLSFDLTNACSCESLDENDNPIPTEYCWGDCYDIALEHLVEQVIEPWQNYHELGSTSELQVKGSRMGWTRASGTAFTDVETLLDTLTFDGEWRLVFTLDSKHDLSVVRYSHDEPTGASFTIEPKGFYECVDCGTILGETRTPVCQPCYAGAN
jgi:hypothetical protein